MYKGNSYEQPPVTTGSSKVYSRHRAKAKKKKNNRQLRHKKKHDIYSIYK